MLNRLRSLSRALFHRTPFEAGMAEEMRFHLETLTEELMRGGLTRAEASRRARLEFGSVDSVKDDCREARGLRLFDELKRHLRLAVRQLRKSPGFTATALATLALCLGANLALFAVVDSVLLRPLPFPEADRLLRVFNTYPKAGVPDDGCSITNYYERRGRLPALTSLAAYREGSAIVGEAGATEREPMTQVSPEFFATLGLGPVRGRAFTEEEMLPGNDAVVVVSDGYWRQRLQADPDAVGRTLRVDGIAMRVVGVLPPEFRYLSSRSRLFLPYTSKPEQRQPARRHWGSSSQMIARLQPGATVAEAQAQLDAQNTALEGDTTEARFMADAGFRTLAVPLHADHVAGIRQTLLLVQAGALCLLLIGAVNLANLLLVRASARGREIAVRRALGASRGRLVAAALTESVLLTVCGSLLGLGVGAGALRLFAALGADRLPLGADLTLGVRSLAVALAGAAALGLAMGLPGAWLGFRGEAAAALQAEPRTATANRTLQRVRHGFLVAQVALAFVLLTGAGLLSTSLEKALAVSPGFRPENVMTGHLSLPWTGYPDGAARLAFTERLTEALRREPGVLSVGVATNVPLSGNTNKHSANVKGFVRKAGEPLRGHYAYGVGGDAFTALGIPVVEGRLLVDADSRRRDRVCVVDEDFARWYWPEGNALGQRLFQGGQPGPDAEAFTVVGVVAATKQAGLTDGAAQGALYYPYGHWPGDHGLFVIVRTGRSPEAVAGVLQAVVRRLDPELPVSDLRSMETRIADSLVARRSPAVLATLFSALAVLLTAIGTYGVLSYAVTQRRREIGLRMALGARPAQVGRQFLTVALRLLAAGAVAGVVGAALLGKTLQTVLFQVPAFHAPTLARTALLLTVASLAACLLPSRRATRIAPMEALNEP